MNTLAFIVALFFSLILLAHIVFAATSNEDSKPAITFAMILLCALSWGWVHWLAH